jgi:hypothetical protein
MTVQAAASIGVVVVSFLLSELAKELIMNTIKKLSGVMAAKAIPG